MKQPIVSHRIEAHNAIVSEFVADRDITGFYIRGRQELRQFFFRTAYLGEVELIGAEKKIVDEALERALKAAECIIEKNVGEAQNRYN